MIFEISLYKLSVSIICIIYVILCYEVKDLCSTIQKVFSTRVRRNGDFLFKFVDFYSVLSKVLSYFTVK